MQFNRRDFLHCAMAAVAAGVSGCRCPFGADERTRVALQLYSVRGLMKDPEGFRRTLKAVRDIGYTGVEFAGYGGFRSRELKEMLDQLGLGRAGAHLGIDALRPDKIQETIDFNLGYGNKMLTVSWANVPKGCEDRAGFWKKLAEELSTAADTARASGCMVGYHNHQHEFRDKIKGVTPFQLIFDNASPLVRLQADVGHMVSAGVDPVEWLRRYPGRSYAFHAKEVYGGNSGATGVLGQPGKANGVDWDELFKLVDAEKMVWCVVECESNPNTLEHVKASFDFLRAKGRL